MRRISSLGHASGQKPDATKARCISGGDEDGARRGSRTSSHFLPYPGFLSFPYPEYSEIYFGEEYRVLRGGSWATDAIIARGSFRNWELPNRRHLFPGFCCARDA